MNQSQIEIRPRLRVMAGREIALGPGKMELLEALRQTGSISRAAREMGMSYMRAWTLIRTMNRCFQKPVVVSTHGGAHGGGGAQLTATGRKVLALYKRMNAKCLNAVAAEASQLESLLKKDA